MSLVLTFSRRYCTGVSVIADTISKRLNIPVYGKDYICKDIHNKEDIEKQNETIRNLAQESCIIIGRGASEALKEQRNVINIYVYADKEDRIKRAMKKENISKEEAIKRVKEVDTERIEYYEKNTGKFWGDMDGYDIILDSSKYGIENCADVICKYLEARCLI
jgi:hypothetical protein